MPKKVEKKGAKKKPAAKRAVSKSVVKKAAKKATKSTSSKSVAKKATKKIVSKKVSRKVAKKHAVTQKLPKQKESKKTVDSRSEALEHLFRKSPELSSKEDSVSQSTLPSHMSLRAIEKANAIRTILSEKIAIKVGSFVYVAALMFILFGGLATVQQIIVIDTTSTNQLASLSNLKTEPTDVTTNIIPAVEPTRIAKKAAIPKNLTGEQRATFSIDNANEVFVFLENVNTGMRFKLPTDMVEEGEYEFIIPNGLAAGQYSIQVTARGDDDVAYDFRLASFTVPKIEQVEVTSTEDEISENTEEAEKPIHASSTVVSDFVPPTPTSTTPNRFSLFSSTKLFTESQMLFLQVPRDIDDLNVYIFKEGAYTHQFVGTPNKSFSTWRLFFDISNFPNGKYNLQAKGSVNGQSIESEILPIQIQKNVAKPEITVSTEPQNNESAESGTKEEEAAQVENQREFSELSLNPDKPIDPESAAIVTELLRDNKADLEILLRNYSVAAQTNDELAKRLASEAIERKREALKDADVLTTNTIENELGNRLASLQDRIDTFEELRRSRSDGVTAKDSDGDGISDTDEEQLFKTDPNDPDTDEDGILDGVEIMRGFNPRLAVNEAGIIYESPKETLGLEQPEVLQVTRASAAIAADVESEEMMVRTVITGTALPNSYVTLYVFSSPTIVTVQTDDAGAFSYTFTKELADGTHEAYVAITDNTGQIVAQSSGFVFTKQAQAITAGAQSTTNAALPVNSPATPYGLGLALGVLALGVILLMLGIGLRQNQPVTV